MTAELDKALRTACEQGDISAAEKLIAEGANINPTDAQSPLVYAVSAGKADCARWLIAHGAEVNLQSGDAANALHCAGFYGQLECARLLVDAGADLNAVYAKGKTAAQVARDQKHPEVAEFLELHPNLLSFTRALGNRVVEEIYDFRDRERVTLLRQCVGGAVETMQRETFSALAETPALRRAFEEHRRRGGTLAEEATPLQLPGKARVLKREGP
jgi:ankyrin repeat protein